MLVSHLSSIYIYLFPFPYVLFFIHIRYIVQNHRSLYCFYTHPLPAALLHGHSNSSDVGGITSGKVLFFSFFSSLFFCSSFICPTNQTLLPTVFGVSFPPFDTAAKLLAQEEIEALVAAMRKLAPDTGAYLNEANPYEPDFGRAFWGNKYERLLEIKRRVDPDDVLWCVPCVGNERWQETDDGRLCRV